MNATETSAGGEGDGGVGLGADGTGPGAAGAAASHAASSETSSVVSSARRMLAVLLLCSGVYEAPRRWTVTTSGYAVSRPLGRTSLYSQQEVDEVLQLVAKGWNDCQISRRMGISRSTVNRWRHGATPWDLGGRRIHRGGWCPRCDGTTLDEPAYVYLLGLYLGDGHIVRERRTYRFAIFQDARYPHLVNLATRTIMRVRDGHGRVSFVRRDGCVAVTGHWNHWPCLFPQHGPGMKHQRSIVLVDWQNELMERYPRQLLRGLIHSDGCRTINRVQRKRYSYVRYFFNNKSRDILQIFRDACDAIGVRHRDCRPDMISVARRDCVAKLDAFVGPKS